MKLIIGRKIRFWEDNWCGRVPLCEAFPDLYSIAGTKGVMAADFWVDQGVLGVWDPKFLRSFNDWEMDTIQAFIDLTSNLGDIPNADISFVRLLLYGSYGYT